MDELIKNNKETNEKESDLTGKFLIANPYTNFNDVFKRSLIYVASHSEQGAIGLIVNHMVNQMPFKSVFKMLKTESPMEEDNQNPVPVFLGGPVEPERGFILHSSEYTKNLLFKLKGNLAVSSNINILQDIAHGQGPEHSLFIMGYTGWGAGQLEKEIEENNWIISECDENIIFDENSEQKWQKALEKVGIDKTYYSAQAGHS